MRIFISLSITVAVCSASARANAPKPGPTKETSAEMTKAVHLLDQSFGLESAPPPHCLKWGYGHEITVDEVKACAKKALDGQVLPGLGTKYVLATLMADVGPQTIIAVSIDPADWVLLSCDPGRPCPPRKPGTDKMGKRVIDVMQRACAKPTTLWLPEKKGCPSGAPAPAPAPAPSPAPAAPKKP
jgi:hypothetical protein